MRSLQSTLLAAAAAILAMLPGDAFASRVTVTRVSFVDGEAPAVFVDGGSGAAPGTSFGTTNRIFIEDDSSCAQFPTTCNAFIVRDIGATLLAEGPHCTQLSPNAARCSGAQVGDTRRYSVLLGDANDSLTVNSPYLNRGGAIQGGSGDDSFSLPLRAPDFISGGTGIDSLSYLGRTQAPGIRIDSVNDGVFNEGQSNEDRVVPDIERVTGTNFDDTMVVPNQQVSGRVPHGILSGADGNDVLGGSSFPDRLNGGAGEDHLNGLAGDDSLESRESATLGQTVARDDVRCGSGNNDVAVVDLQDEVAFGCETISRAAIDEGGILTILTRKARIRDGRVRLRLHCPKSSKTPCRGRLTLKRGRRKLGSASYRIRRGGRKRVAVPVKSAGRAQATAVEPDSQGRPKTTVARVTLR